QLLAVQNNGVQSIPVGSSFSGTLSSLAFANAATVVAVVNYDGSLPGNAPPISPYLSTGTVAPDEWVTYNNVSNEQDRVSDPVTCPPHAVITTTVSSGGAGCDDLVSYEITICNTGDADAFVNATLPITPPGAIQVNNTAVPATYTNGLVWATYYGGTDGDDGYSVAIDPTGNVYVAGTTQSNTGIATPGAHQTTEGGGRDAFLVKFDTDGNRLWGTYYGGDENDEGMGVTTDAAGNVYLVGHTESSFAIATPGTFQTAWDDGEDAFVVKFNSAGVRQWGTYCGGPDPDFGFSVAVDASGNVYLGGTTEGSTNIASAGAHQTTFGGTMDQFLVKFNSTGGRIWGTLYGGSGEDIEADVALDAAGNVYLTGQTQSATAISTAGSHQPVYNGDDDLYLVKFNPAGVRQWGTYYGGLQQETMPCVAVDPLGNVYLGGTTKSPTAIASGALHQPAFGGSRDAFVAKFSSAGVRQWGTYHGGADADEAGD
ncbi:MAG: SBBP repeat-containing protein, partial [Flavobacteriales bacterium]|nr:SBBP repeat-containing protein [Flavobacteriales bacterium]